MPRLYARMDYWREFPAPHVLLRNIAVGIGVFEPPKKRRASSAGGRDRLAEQGKAMLAQVVAARAVKKQSA